MLRQGTYLWRPRRRSQRGRAQRQGRACAERAQEGQRSGRASRARFKGLQAGVRSRGNHSGVPFTNHGTISGAQHLVEMGLSPWSDRSSTSRTRKCAAPSSSPARSRKASSPISSSSTAIRSTTSVVARQSRMKWGSGRRDRDRRDQAETSRIAEFAPGGQYKETAAGGRRRARSPLPMREYGCASSARAVRRSTRSTGCRHRSSSFYYFSGQKVRYGCRQAQLRGSPRASRRSVVGPGDVRARLHRPYRLSRQPIYPSSVLLRRTDRIGGLRDVWSKELDRGRSRSSRRGDLYHMPVTDYRRIKQD